MTGLVDYAGLFPPAALDVPKAVAAYGAHRKQAEAWMLGRFIAPAARLEAVAAAVAAERPPAAVWPFAVLVGAADDAEAARSAVPAQGAAVAVFEEAGDGRTPVEALETPVPAAAARADAMAFLDRLTGDLVAAGLGGCEMFWETPAGGDDAGVVAAVAALVRSGAPFPRQGVKLRCGGVTAGAFPSCERVAAVVALCRDHDVPLKGTAGLHHPLRHRADDPDVMMHGFLNVFGAGLLAWGLGAGTDVLTACIAETDPTAFRLTDTEFAWRDQAVPAAAVADIRRRWLCGFGSCSFDEPRADLVDLGLL
jgi:hypothetical protein